MLIIHASTKLRILILYFFLFNFNSQASDKNKDSHEENTVLIDNVLVKETDRYLMVPKAIIEIIEENYVKKFRDQHPELSQTEGEILAKIPRRSMNLKLRIIEKNIGVLKSNSEILTGRGGARIDLADFLTGVKGDFFVKINFEDKNLIEEGELKVYFIGDAKQKSVEKKTWGSGCNKIIDITDFFKSTISQGDGWRFNSSNFRHWNAIAGSFIFSIYLNEELYLTTITFLDSRVKTGYCK